ncbi:hypothetical protein GSbR_09080 [Geobacter sp. SVR]|nr:hypothetical protein GSVR_12320 [Geobacter sp. SVR]GCF84308.1 hypothetical protein GSbR_09080 [Geobacter sp. SVR]
MLSRPGRPECDRNEDSHKRFRMTEFSRTFEYQGHDALALNPIDTKEHSHT